MTICNRQLADGDWRVYDYELDEETQKRINDHVRQEFNEMGEQYEDVRWKVWVLNGGTKWYIPESRVVPGEDNVFECFNGSLRFLDHETAMREFDECSGKAYVDGEWLSAEEMTDSQVEAVLDTISRPYDADEPMSVAYDEANASSSSNRDWLGIFLDRLTIPYNPFA